MSNKNTTETCPSLLYEIEGVVINASQPETFGNTRGQRIEIKEHGSKPNMLVADLYGYSKELRKGDEGVFHFSLRKRTTKTGHTFPKIIIESYELK